MPLYKHQQRLVDINPNKHLLAWACGTGKSFAAMALTERKKEILDDFGVLVICPKSLKDKWTRDILEHSRWTYEQFAVMSKEEFKKHHKTLRRYPVVVVDEAHFFYGMTSQLHKALLWYLDSHRIIYRYYLTATPYMRTMWNLYAALKLMGLQVDYMDWSRKYFDKIQMGFTLTKQGRRIPRMVPVQKKGLEAEAGRIVKLIGTTVKMEECFDVPPQVFKIETFDLTADQKRGMKELVDLLPVVRFTKEHQICGGALKGDGYEKEQIFESQKLKRLEEYVASSEAGVAIVCKYNAEVDLLSERLRDFGRVFNITGHTKNRDAVIQEINITDNPIVIINAACSEGWEIPRVPIMIFYSLDFSLKNYVQMLGRIQRANNLKRNAYIHFTVKKSIDEQIYQKVVVEKQDFQEAIYEKECRLRKGSKVL